MATKPKAKELLTIPETAKLLGCTDINVYHHIKAGNIKRVLKPTFIQIASGKFVLTGESRRYITRQSVEDKLSGESKRNVKGKQIFAKYIDGVDKVFENEKKEIVFPSETVAAEVLKIGKFALRGRLEKGSLVHGEIEVSVWKGK